MSAELRKHAAERTLLIAIKQLLREIRKMNRKNREIFDDDDLDLED